MREEEFLYVKLFLLIQISELQPVMERPLQPPRTAAAEWTGVSIVLKPVVMIVL
jgi:hypothetical protein